MKKKHHRRGFRMEAKHHPLASWPHFIGRVLRYFAAASTLIGISLIIGMFGYRYLEDLPWVDSFANAAMILSGMGPMHIPQTDTGKIFAGIYALYSGLALLVAAGILFTPMAHRLLHLFHLELEEEEPKGHDMHRHS